MKPCLVVDNSKTIRIVARGNPEDLKFAVEEAGDGYNVLWERSDEGQSVVVFCANEDQPSLMNKSIPVGADEYLTKPFGREIVQSKLAQVGIL